MDLFKSLREYFLLLGIPGLFFIALLDSAAVPMMGGPDAVVLLLAWQSPGLMVWIGLSAALGSLLGCLLLYHMGRVGGRLALARSRERGLSWAQRNIGEHALLALLLATLAPPPFPMKPVVLAAGVIRVERWKLIAGVLLGRLARYGLLAFVGARFGDEAEQVLRRYSLQAALILVGILILVVVLRRLRRPDRAALSVPASSRDAE
ncbi:MAG: hypothetical protein FJW35_05940 [Acidobacteria bacterium]|nr:hypothetical protein [Acidobacteriota bacterium]